MRMIYRSIAMAAVAAMAFAGPAGAGPLAKAEVARLFPGQFEAKVKGYRVSFSGSRSGALQGEAYGQQDTGRWFMKGESSVWSGKNGPTASPDAVGSRSRAAGTWPAMGAARC